MENEEYALMLMEDKSLSDVEIVNLSGILKDCSTDDIPGIIHAVNILKNADPRFLRQSAKEVFYYGRGKTKKFKS